MFFKLFNFKKNKTIEIPANGTCINKKLPNNLLSYCLVLSNNEKTFDEFLGAQYDYDMAKGGILVWPSYNEYKRIKYCKIYYIPFKSYIIHDNETGLLNVVDEKTFKSQYKIE